MQYDKLFPSSIFLKRNLENNCHIALGTVPSYRLEAATLETLAQVSSGTFSETFKNIFYKTPLETSSTGNQQITIND